MSLGFYIDCWRPIHKTMSDEECEQIEANRRNARREIKEIIRNNLLSCDCDYETYDLDEMLAHLSTCKFGFGLTGDEIRKRFNEMNLRDYRQKHICSTCHYCGKSFTDPRYGGKHLLQQHLSRGGLKCLDKVLKTKINEMSVADKKKVFEFISSLDE